jgi:hypothetical protein
VMIAKLTRNKPRNSMNGRPFGEDRWIVYPDLLPWRGAGLKDDACAHGGGDTIWSHAAGIIRWGFKP